MTPPDPHQSQGGRFYGIEGSICQEYPCPDPLLSQSKRFYGIRDLCCQEMTSPDPHQSQGGRFYGIGGPCCQEMTSPDPHQSQGGRFCGIGVGLGTNVDVGMAEQCGRGDFQSPAARAHRATSELICFMLLAHELREMRQCFGNVDLLGADGRTRPAPDAGTWMLVGRHGTERHWGYEGEVRT